MRTTFQLHAESAAGGGQESITGDIKEAVVENLFQGTTDMIQKFGYHITYADGGTPVPPPKLLKASEDVVLNGEFCLSKFNAVAYPFPETPDQVPDFICFFFIHCCRGFGYSYWDAV